MTRRSAGARKPVKRGAAGKTREEREREEAKRKLEAEQREQREQNEDEILPDFPVLDADEGLTDAPEVTKRVKPEDLLAELDHIGKYASRLKKRGDLHGDALKKLADAVEDLHEGYKEYQRDENRRRLPLSDAMRGPDMSFVPESGRAQLYRYLMTHDPEQLGYASMFRGGASLPRHIQALMRRKTVDEVTQSRLLELQAMNDVLFVSDMVMSANNDSNYAAMPRRQRMKRLKVYRDFQSLSEEVRDAAMDTATAAEGGDWVPTILSSQIKTLINAELALAGFFDFAPMPGKIWENPVEGADAIAYLVSEALDDPAAAAAKPTASVPGTRKMTLTAVKLGARTVLSDEAEEDIIVPAVPHVMERIARAIARGREKAIIDGQPSGTIDTGDVPAAGDVRLAWDGLRKQQKVVGAGMEVDLAVLSAEALANMRGVLKEYGSPSSDLLWITGYSGFVRLLTLYDKTTGGSPFVLMANQFGPDNTFRTGTIAALFGSPLVISQFVREDLTANGIFDGVTMTKTILLLTNRRVWQGGERRVVTLRTLREVKAETGQIVVMGTWRGDFKKVNYAGTQRFTALGRNITSF